MIEAFFETKFLKEAKKNYHRIENGKMMFIYQAHQAFAIWHKILPKINEETIKLTLDTNIQFLISPS